MRLRTALNLFLSFLITALLASATGIPHLRPPMSSDFRVDGLNAKDSNHGSQLISDIPLFDDAVKITGTVELASTTLGSIVSSDDQVDTLTSGFTSTELVTGDPERMMKFLWLSGLTALVAAVAASSMIRYNKRNNEVVEAMSKCSFCFSTKTLTSRWRWYELPLWLFTARPIRCFSCQRRQFAWAWTRKHGAGKPSQDLVPAQ